MAERMAGGWLSNNTFGGGFYDGLLSDVTGQQFILTSYARLQFGSRKVSRAGGWLYMLGNDQTVIAEQDVSSYGTILIFGWSVRLPPTE